jgi:hypothetical protein
VTPSAACLQLALLATAVLLLNQGLRQWQLGVLRRQGSPQP